MNLGKLLKTAVKVAKKPALKFAAKRLGISYEEAKAIAQAAGKVV